MDQVIAEKGQDVLEVFSEVERNKRRILQRYTHDKPGFSIRISTLINSMQPPHYHTELSEAIMLIQGTIRAYWWDSRSVDDFLLNETGDIVIFPPAVSHTLDIIDDNTQVVVFKFFCGTGSQDRVSSEYVPNEIKERLLQRE